MKKVVCAGCGLTEPLGEKDKIQKVTVVFGEPGRHFDPTNSYSEDICVECQNRLLYNFFGQKNATGEAPIALRVA